MTRRQSVLVAMGLALAVMWPQLHANAATPGAVHIRSVDTSAFPAVAVTVSIAGTPSVASQDVKVTEDGRSVSAVTVKPLAQSGQEIDVVLALDTSNSMGGQPLASAIAAALRFVTTLPSNQPIKVGIVEFARRPTVVQAVTSDRAALLTRLGSLHTTQGTALYDAVITAAHLFTGSGQRNVVLLTDGGDRSSRSKLGDAVSAARAAHATVFTVGLKTHDTDVKVLRSLAKATGGQYAPAGAADLSNVYTRLASELAHQYVVAYRSTRRAGGQVTVAVGAAGAGDSALVLEPKVQPPPAPAVSPGPAHPLLASGTGLLIVLGLSFLTAFVLLIMVFGARARSRSDRELVRRVATSPQPDQAVMASADRERGLASWIPESVVQAGQKVADAAGMGQKVALMLERGALPVRPGEFVAGVGLATILGVLVSGVLLHNPIFMVLIGAAAAVIPIVYVRVKVKKRSQKLHGQLADILMILASSLRAGHGFFQALDLVAKEIGEPGAQEFGRVVAEVRLGRPVDEALNHMAERVGSDDFKWAVLGVNIQREVGGNLAEILDTIADTVRERDGVRRQVQVLSSEGRLSIGILSALPFLVSLYIAKVNPGYLNLLFSTRIGLIMVVTAVCLLGVGIFWMRKIVNIDV